MEIQVTDGEGLSIFLVSSCSHVQSSDHLLPALIKNLIVSERPCEVLDRSQAVPNLLFLCSHAEIRNMKAC